MDYGFDVSSLFKASSDLSQVCALSGSLLVQFSKSFVCSSGLDPCMFHWGMSLGVYKQLYGVTFLSSFLSVISQILPDSLRLPLLVL